MTDAIDAARGRLAASILAEWSEQDLKDLARLLRKFADDMMAGMSNTGET